MLEPKEKLAFEKPELLEEQISEKIDEVLEVFAIDGRGSGY
tara:strand:+ start:38987 stop:39109 length:123 start_codon:yes stop_codon:yes gene_type:complete